MKAVRVIKTEGQLQTELGRLFERQAADFLGEGVERVEFDARFTPDRDHIFEIKNFELSDDIRDAAKAPLEVEPFKPSKSDPATLKAILATSYDPRTDEVVVLVQRSSRSRILEGGWTLFWHGGGFQRVIEPGLSLEDEVVAVFEAGSLLFRNFRLVNPILDIKDYFVEATEDQIRTALEHQLFYSEDTEPLLKLCDMTMRRRVAFIMASGILEKATPRKVCAGLKTYFDDIELSYTSRGGSERLRLPTKKRDLKRLLNYLCEAYYIGDVTSEKYEANSHRPMR